MRKKLKRKAEGTIETEFSDKTAGSRHQDLSPSLEEIGQQDSTLHHPRESVALGRLGTEENLFSLF